MEHNSRKSIENINITHIKSRADLVELDEKLNRFIVLFVTETCTSCKRATERTEQLMIDIPEYGKLYRVNIEEIGIEYARAHNMISVPFWMVKTEDGTNFARSFVELKDFLSRV